MDLDPEIYKELLKTFKQEFDDLVEEMTGLLLTLEKEADELKKEELINSIFRVAHTLKGSARSVEIMNVGDIGHKLEDIFGLVKQKEIQISAGLIDLCFKAIDAMKLAMADFLENMNSSFDISNIINELSQVVTGEGDVGLGKSDASLSSTVTARESSETLKNADEVIRVSVANIDKITALSDELQAIKLETDTFLTMVSKDVTLLSSLERLSKKLLFYTNVERSEALDITDLNDTAISMIDYTSKLSSHMSTLHASMRNTTNDLGLISNELQDKVRKLRLVSAGTILNPMMRSARDISRELNKEVDIAISGEEIQIDRTVLEKAKGPLLHLLRNAIDHGIESPDERVKQGKDKVGKILLSARNHGDQVQIIIEDDGMGIDVDTISKSIISKHLLSAEECEKLSHDELIDYIFHPGFSTRDEVTEISGRGVGLDVVRTNIRSIKGNVKLQSEKSKYTKIILSLPLTLVSDRGMLVKAGSQVFSLPTFSIKRVVELSREHVNAIEGVQSILEDGQPIVLKNLAQILGVNNNINTTKNTFSAVIVTNDLVDVAFIVDAIIGEREIVIKNLSKPLSYVKNTTGVTLTGSGEIIVVLNSHELIDSAMEANFQAINFSDNNDTKKQKQFHIMVVDDSLTTRALQTNILEIRGYKVTACVDGQDAWETLKQRDFDLIITDINMPNMNGFELIKLIKNDPNYAKIPVIIVSSEDNPTERKKGMDVQADAYIVKSKFETTKLLDAVSRFL